MYNNGITNYATILYQGSIKNVFKSKVGVIKS